MLLLGLELLLVVVRQNLLLPQLLHLLLQLLPLPQHALNALERLRPELVLGHPGGQLVRLLRAGQALHAGGPCGRGGA